MQNIASICRGAMRLIHKRLCLAGAGFMMLGASVSTAQHAGLISLIDTRNGDLLAAWDEWPNSQTSLRPVINDHGMVGFSAAFPVGEDDADWWQVYTHTSTPGVVTKLNQNVYGSWSLWSQWSYAIDNSNNFLWLNDDMGDRLLASVNPSSPNNPVFYHSTANYISGRSLGMNNNGFLAYRADGQVRVYDSTHDILRVITTPSAGVLGTLGATAINDHRQVAFSTIEGDLYVYDWDTDTTLTLIPSNNITGRIPPPAPLSGVQSVINNQGLIAFYGQDVNENIGLYTMHLSDPTGIAQWIADISMEAYFSIAMNDKGQILFTDTEWDNDLGYVDHLMLWTGTELLKLISLGDTFNGGIITMFDYSSYALNERGEIVFGYHLDDDTQGIAYMLIPEPALSVLGLAGILLLYGYYRRSIRRN